MGTHICRALLEQGGRVRVLDDLSSERGSSSQEEILPSRRDRLEFRVGDVRSASDIGPALRGIGTVIHCAAFRTVRSWEDPLLTHEINASATLRLLEAALTAGVERFVFASTAAVYGNSAGFPQSESQPAMPDSPYAASKLAAEKYCAFFSRESSLETVSLRYFNVYGPGQNPGSRYSGVITAFVTSLLDDRPCPVYGDGLQSRDFIYVDDAVAATLAACRRPGASGRIINVGSGRSYTILQLAERLARLLGKVPSVQFLDARPHDIARMQADIGLMQEILGTEPDTDLDEGLSQTVAWFLGRPRSR